MSWKDEEGDDIVVSSNGEVQAALEECPGAPNSTLKMNVTVTVSKAEERVPVDCETAQLVDDDGIRVTGSDDGEFVLLNPNDHVDVPVYPTPEEASATAPPAETTASLLPPPLTPIPAPDPSGQRSQSASATVRGRGFGRVGASSNRTPFTLTVLLSWLNCASSNGG